MHRNAAKLCYSKHAFSEKNPLFTLFFRFFLDFALSEAIFKTLKNAGNWVEVGKKLFKTFLHLPNFKISTGPGGFPRRYDFQITGPKFYFFKNRRFLIVFSLFSVFLETFLLPGPGPFSGNEELEAKNR